MFEAILLLGLLGLFASHRRLEKRVAALGRAGGVFALVLLSSFPTHLLILLLLLQSLLVPLPLLHLFHLPSLFPGRRRRLPVPLGPRPTIPPSNVVTAPTSTPASLPSNVPSLLSVSWSPLSLSQATLLPSTSAALLMASVSHEKCPKETSSVKQASTFASSRNERRDWPKNQLG